MNKDFKMDKFSKRRRDICNTSLQLMMALMKRQLTED